MERFDAGLRAPRILRELRERGYTGGLAILKAHLQTLGPHRPTRRVFRRFETGPGLEAQSDWSPYRVMIAAHETIVHAFAMVLAYSRRYFVAFFRDERLPTLLWAHLEAFRYHGGLCRRIACDNQTAITLGRAGGTLDGFDWVARPQLSPLVVKELLTCRFVEEHRNVILVGRPSTGKTTVAKALGHAACARALSVYYASMAAVLQTLHAARADGTYRKVFRRVTGPGLLILDDAGFADLGRDAANELFRVVCARHRERSTIVVSNLPFKHWAEFLPSPAQAVAIADRTNDAEWRRGARGLHRTENPGVGGGGSSSLAPVSYVPACLIAVRFSKAYCL
jgi:hypothetical protein